MIKKERNKKKKMSIKLSELLVNENSKEKIKTIIAFEFIFAFSWVYFYQELKDVILLFYFDLGITFISEYVMLLLLFKTLLLSSFDFFFLLLLFFVLFKENENCYYFDPLVILLLLTKLNKNITKNENTKYNSNKYDNRYLIPITQIFAIFICIVIYAISKDERVHMNLIVVEEYVKKKLVEYNNDMDVKIININLISSLFEINNTHHYQSKIIIIRFVILFICITVTYLIGINKTLKERNYLIPFSVAFFDILLSFFGDHSVSFLKCLFYSIINFEFICLFMNVIVFIIFYLLFVRVYHENSDSEINEQETKMIKIYNNNDDSNDVNDDDDIDQYLDEKNYNTNELINVELVDDNTTIDMQKFFKTIVANKIINNNEKN